MPVWQCKCWTRSKPHELLAIVDLEADDLPRRVIELDLPKPDGEITRRTFVRTMAYEASRQATYYEKE